MESIKSKHINVVLIGNPNTGKTSVFNRLTGMNQKVGNYPGVTVDKKEGKFKLDDGTKVTIQDLPGTYSLNPNSLDENVVLDFLLNKENIEKTNLFLLVSDVENLKRNLLIFTQLKDLHLPISLIINMADMMERKGIELDKKLLSEKLNTQIVFVSAKSGKGIDDLKTLIQDYQTVEENPTTDISTLDHSLFDKIKNAEKDQNIYTSWLKITQKFATENITSYKIPNTETEVTHNEIKFLQRKETLIRHKFINELMADVLTVKSSGNLEVRSKLDSVLLHPVWGYLIFFGILLLMFQAIYDWSSYPMDWIETGFVNLSNWTKESMPTGMFTNLISEGLIPGIGGVVIFIPQIAFLFLFISILEESGYMSRVVFIADRIMRKFGLSGKSVVPLISGTACAIPAVMATRNIENWKERLITILVTPFITCSARLPVYLIIISLVIPSHKFLGMSYQAITLLLLYLLGFVMAIGSAYVLNKILKIKSNSDFVIEMPNYKLPMLKNTFFTVYDKTKSFVLGAGKIIVSIAIVLWFLASHGFSDNFENAEKIVTENNISENLSEEELSKKIAAFKLENSYIGVASKSIEPVIKPLGFDWKIGIALISSFAAREVFVGTLATIYSVGQDEQETIKNRMQQETKADGSPLFTFASGVSLLLFYAFALQCMSTLAVVKKETGGWKWPMVQLFGMTGFAYLVSLIAYQILS